MGTGGFEAPAASGAPGELFRAIDWKGALSAEASQKRAGVLPYLTLFAGAAVVLAANWFFQLPA